MYDFKTPTFDRKKMSIKWNIMLKNDPASDLPPLSVADMEFITAPEIESALSNHFKTQPLGYSEPTEHYYAALVNWYKTRHKAVIDPESIVIGTGVISALLALIETLTQPKDGIVIMTPVYPQFYRVIKALDREIVPSALIHKDNTYTIDFESLEACFKQEHTRALILCNPHNPVGRVWTKEELTRINDLAVKYDVRIFSDEIHGDLILPGYEHTVFTTINPDSIVLSSASKTFNLAALQCAFLIMNSKEDRNKFAEYEARIGAHGANVAGLVASQAAYEYGAAWLDSLLEILHDNYQLLVTRLQKTKINVAPLEGTYLAWLDFTAYGQDYKVLEKTLKAHHLHFSSGQDFGTEGEGFFRMNLAMPHDVLNEVINRILDVTSKI